MDWLKETIGDFRVKEDQRAKEKAEKEKDNKRKTKNNKKESIEILLGIKDEFIKIKDGLKREGYPCLIEINGKYDESQVNENISSVSLSCATKMPQWTNKLSIHDGSSISFTIDYKFENFEIRILLKGNSEGPTVFSKPKEVVTSDYIENEIKKFIKQVFA